MPGDKAVIGKDGDRLILEPAERKSLLAVLAEMSPLEPEDAFPDVDETLPPLDDDPFTVRPPAR